MPQAEEWLEGDPDGKMPVGLEMLRQMVALFERRVMEAPGRDLEAAQHLAAQHLHERLLWHTLLPLAREWDLSVDVVRVPSQAVAPAQSAALVSSGQLHGEYGANADPPCIHSTCMRQSARRASGSCLALLACFWLCNCGQCLDSTIGGCATVMTLGSCILITVSA